MLLSPTPPVRRVSATCFSAKGPRTVLLALKPRGLRRLKAVPEGVREHPNTAWVHLCHEGKWAGHPSGEFAFGRDTLDQLVANYEKQKTPVPFKYEHPIAIGEPVPSAGTVYELRIQDGKLYALTLFTDRAAEMIRAREYSYCSVVVALESVDRVTGEPIGAELIEVGLTDTPFIDGQDPIRLPEAKAA